MQEKTQIIKIGTRGSALALRQVELVRAALTEAYPELQTEVVIIKTSGDWRPEEGETRLNAQAGGKGLFAKEIEQALLAGEIDAAVHSMKDMEAALPPGLQIRHMLPREDVRDALIVSDPAQKLGGIDGLSENAVVGTASVRREAALKSLRPDIRVVPLRGNVETRIKKCREGQVDATFLAHAGLKRLGLAHEISCVLEPEVMLPAAGQGAVGIETRADDKGVSALFDSISCALTLTQVTAERGVLAALDGSCRTPVGDIMNLQAQLWSFDGSATYTHSDSAEIATLQDAARLGAQVGEALKKKAPSDIFVMPAVEVGR